MTLQRKNETISKTVKYSIKTNSLQNGLDGFENFQDINKYIFHIFSHCPLLKKTPSIHCAPIRKFSGFTLTLSNLFRSLRSQKPLQESFIKLYNCTISRHLTSRRQARDALYSQYFGEQILSYIIPYLGQKVIDSENGALNF